MEAEIDTSPAPFAGRDQEWTELVHDLRDARALLAKLNGVQFAPTEERLAVVAEVSAYLAGGDRG
jgi:hypothetical protein